MTSESALCPVPRARMKPQRPHVHRFRFERPEGFVSRGRCGCGAFQTAWADGMSPEGLTKRPRREVTPVSVLRERNVAAWEEAAAAAAAVPSSQFPEADEAPAVVVEVRWPAEGSVTRRGAEMVRAARGEWVSAGELAAALYGSNHPGNRAKATSAMFQARAVCGLPVEADHRGPGSRGYRWRGE